MNLESKLPPMPTVTFLSANDVAKELLPGSDFDTANAFAVSHVSAAIENRVSGFSGGREPLK